MMLGFFLLLRCACCYNHFNPTHALIYVLKHQLTLIFKTLKNTLATSPKCS